MKETRFIAQNKEKWEESERLLKESDKDPEKLSNLFTQVIDDLSYSRTYYPNRSVRVYLNRIAREYFSVLYSHHKSRRNTFRNFWGDELPQIVYQSRRPLTISFIIFVVAACIGVFSSAKDPEFASTILGEGYVAMTKANIEKGDPMAVYKEAHQVQMFLGITLNNLMVAFRTYVSGIFFSIGTVAVLLYNGIMVGCFQFFFIERGLFAESALTIWQHGTLEISAIILAGGAGLTLGSGLLFPGTYSRLQAFQVTAMRSLKLMLGIAPIIVLAGLIESFLTRYTEVPDVLRLFVILLSALFVIGYFVYYPWMKSRRGFDILLGEVRLPPDLHDPVSITEIKKNGDILKDAFTFYRRFFSGIFKWVILVTLLMTTAELFTPYAREVSFVALEPVFYLLDSVYYAMKTTSPVYILINAVGSSLIIYRVFMLLDADANRVARPPVDLVTLVQTVVVVAAVYSMLYFLEEWGILLVATTASIFLLLCFVQFTEGSFIGQSISRAATLAAASFGQVIGLHFILLMMSFSFLLILSAPLLYMNTSILQWNFAETDVWSKGIVKFIETFLKLLGFNMVVPVFASSMAYLYFSLREVATAGHLKNAIAAIGQKNGRGTRL